MRNGREKPDSVIVARKPANNAGKPGHRDVQCNAVISVELD